VDGAFAFTFIMPKYPHRPEPALDLDMASYGQVKSYADGKDASILICRGSPNGRVRSR
jgi:hypothetical protein